MNDLADKKDIEYCLKRLRDDNDYYGDFGKQFLSNSDIKTLLSNPSLFKQSIEETPALIKGRYFHQAMLEPHKLDEWEFSSCASRNSAKYKSEVAGRGVNFLMLEREKEDVERWVRIMKSNLDMYEEVYADTCEFEKPGLVKIEGLWWKGKADVLAKDCIIDLKTTSSITDFSYSAKKYNYDSQAYIYQTMFGRPLVFFVVDKQTGQLGRFDTSDDFVERGKHKVQKAIEVYERFYGEDAIEDANSYVIRETL